MTQDDIIAFATAMPGVALVIASEETGAPEVAWGDSFFFYDPDDQLPSDRRMPFATIVTKDYEGFDTSSALSRPGVYRLNIAIGRSAFEELIGYAPAAHASQSGLVDYAAEDRLMPHPVYAAQGWVAIVNPDHATADLARTLLTDAHARAAKRYNRRQT